MTKQSGFPNSKWLDDLSGDLPGVVLPCFHCNDSILEALGNSQPNFSSDPAFCKVYPLVLSSFKDQQCFAFIDTPPQGRLRKWIDLVAFVRSFLVHLECHYPGLQDSVSSSSHTFLQS